MDIIRRLEETLAEEDGTLTDDKAHQDFMEAYNSRNVVLAYKIFEDRPGIVDFLTLSQVSNMGMELYMAKRYDEYRDFRRVAYRQLREVAQTLKDEGGQERFKDLLDDLRDDMKWRRDEDKE